MVYLKELKRISRVSILLITCLTIGGTLFPFSRVFAEENRSVTTTLENKSEIPAEVKEVFDLLEQTIATAKTYTDKNRYQASYVEILENEIYGGEIVLEYRNRDDLNLFPELFVNNTKITINYIVQAINNVKAHPNKMILLLVRILTQFTKSTTQITESICTH